MLNEIKRVTGWGLLIDHEAFPLLLAAMSATTILWFFPGVDRLVAVYYPQFRQASAVYLSAPAPMVTSVFEIDMAQGEEEVATEG